MGGWVSERAYMAHGGIDGDPTNHECPALRLATHLCLLGGGGSFGLIDVTSVTPSVFEDKMTGAPCRVFGGLEDALKMR